MQNSFGIFRLPYAECTLLNYYFKFKLDCEKKLRDSIISVGCVDNPRVKGGISLSFLSIT